MIFPTKLTIVAPLLLLNSVSHGKSIEYKTALPANFIPSSLDFKLCDSYLEIKNDESVKSKMSYLFETQLDVENNSVVLTPRSFSKNVVTMENEATKDWYETNFYSCSYPENVSAVSSSFKTDFDESLAQSNLTETAVLKKYTGGGLIWLKNKLTADNYNNLAFSWNLKPLDIQIPGVDSSHIESLLDNDCAVKSMTLTAGGESATIEQDRAECLKIGRSFLQESWPRIVEDPASAENYEKRELSNYALYINDDNCRVGDVCNKARVFTKPLSAHLEKGMPLKATVVLFDGTETGVIEFVVANGEIATVYSKVYLSDRIRENDTKMIALKSIRVLNIELDEDSYSACKDLSASPQILSFLGFPLSSFEEIDDEYFIKAIESGLKVDKVAQIKFDTEKGEVSCEIPFSWSF